MHRPGSDNVAAAAKLCPFASEMVCSRFTFEGYNGSGSSKLMIVAERIALNHHEHWDGSGYPNGLKGDEIPIEARIVALADCVDALSSIRPYRAAWPASAVTDAIRRANGKQFDPDVFDALMRTGFSRSVVPSMPRIVESFMMHAWNGAT